MLASGLGAVSQWWMWITGKAAKEEPLFSPHEQRTPQDHPRAGRGLWCGERQLWQRAQTQCGHHRPQVRPKITLRTRSIASDVTVDLSSGGRRPVPKQPWRRWSSERRRRGRLPQSLMSSSTAASKNCFHCCRLRSRWLYRPVHRSPPFLGFLFFSGRTMSLPILVPRWLTYLWNKRGLFPSNYSLPLLAGIGQNSPSHP